MTNCDTKKKNVNLNRNKLNIIVAYTDKDKYIGYKGDLPWKRNLRGDMNFLKLLLKQESDSVLIMGRKTFESIPVKIHGNVIVITRNSDYKANDVLVFTDFDKSIDYCREKKKICIIFGGTAIYKEAFRYPCKIFHTVVNQGNLTGDTRFEIDDNLNGKNITVEVNNYLLENNLKKTWELCDDHFIENEYKYAFYVTDYSISSAQ